MVGLINPENKPWIPIDVRKWLNSEDVTSMSDSERGIYSQIVFSLWLHGSLPVDPWKLSKLLQTRYESTTRWLQKYAHLVVVLESDGSRFVVPKVQKITEILVKSAPPKKREEKRREENINMGVFEEIQPTEDENDFA